MNDGWTSRLGWKNREFFEFSSVYPRFFHLQSLQVFRFVYIKILNGKFAKRKKVLWQFFYKLEKSKKENLQEKWKVHALYVLIRLSHSLFFSFTFLLETFRSISVIIFVGNFRAVAVHGWQNFQIFSFHFNSSLDFVLI